MPAKPGRPFWWRFPAPAPLVFLLLIGILPWVEVGCQGDPKTLDKNNPAAGMPGGKKSDLKVAQDGYFIVATQNGYQTIWGGNSVGRDMRAIQREFEKEMKPKTGGGGPQPGPVGPDKSKKKEDDIGSAPLVAVYFVLILAAAGVGFGMPPGMIRSIAFGGAVFLAALMLGIQTLIGFPLINEFEKKQKKEQENMKAFGGGPSADAWKPYAKLTIWYYFNWPFLLAPLALVGVEELLNLGAGKKKKKRRFDEDDEDEDDRPRGKRRREDEDEDEDDRPRKRRRAQDEDEDEEPRPRRKAAPPVDEDEPPPRRRTAADDRLTGTPRKKAAPPPEEDDEPPRRRRPAPPEDDPPRKRKRFSDD